MEKNEDIKKLEFFFKDDLRVKKLLNDIVPNYTDFYNDEYKYMYIDKLLKCLDDIDIYINRMLVNYSIADDISILFNKKINELKNSINSRSFYQLLNQGRPSVLKFINDNITDLREEFLDSVKKGFWGYNLFYGYNVLDPVTINEFLHYIHSYIINNENFYFVVPTIKSMKDEDDFREISLRGISNDFGSKLYEEILISNLKSSYIDIINLDERILIMARDLGHATVIEIELDTEKPFVKYYIPKNNNKEMMSALKGIRENENEFAIGEFQTTKENIAQDVCSLMKSIPTDIYKIQAGISK